VRVRVSFRHPFLKLSPAGLESLQLLLGRSKSVLSLPPWFGGGPIGADSFQSGLKRFEALLNRNVFISSLSQIGDAITNGVLAAQLGDSVFPDYGNGLKQVLGHSQMNFGKQQVAVLLLLVGF